MLLLNLKYLSYVLNHPVLYVHYHQCLLRRRRLRHLILNTETGSDLVRLHYHNQKILIILVVLAVLQILLVLMENHRLHDRHQIRLVHR